MSGARAAHFDVAVIGGGPAGAIAAADLARAGYSVALLDRGGRIKPCGGAIPPRAIADFDIPDSALLARARAARITAPSGRAVPMPTQGGFVGMVDRASFDPFLRARAVTAGARLVEAQFRGLTREADGQVEIAYTSPRGEHSLNARMVIGADGANSQLARQHFPAERPRLVFAYHEILAAPDDAYDPALCEIHYHHAISPDFYGWVFPHGDTLSVGTGSAHKGFALREATALLRQRTGLATLQTLRREGAPLPLGIRKRWDNGRDIVLAGDAAGVVAPASGEGIYYAMLGGRLAAAAVAEALQSGDTRALGQARARFMADHKWVFRILGLLQWIYYSSDKRREKFVAMCADPDVQRLTWDSYMHKRLRRAEPAAHMRVLMRDVRSLLGVS